MPFSLQMRFPKSMQAVAWLLLLAMPGEFVVVPFRPAPLLILSQFSNATYGMLDSTMRYPSSQPEQQRQARKQDPVKYANACRKVCAEFLASAKKGATCDCPRGTKMVVGKIPFVCQPVQNCPRSVCVEYTLQGVLQVQETAGNGDEHEDHVTISLQSMEMWAFYRHAAYQGEGTFGNGKTCRQWFLLDGLVYECASCTVCPNGRGIDLDCSNIQPKAVLNQCDTINDDDESSSLDLFSVFDYCPEGGAPKPLTPGTESVTGMEKTTSQASTTWCGDTTKKATWCWTTCLLISTCLYMVHF